MGSEPIDLNDIEALKRRIAELEAAQQAKVSGSGAAALSGGDALGERSVKVDGDNSGSVNTGTIVNHYQAASDKRLTKEQIGQSIARYLRWLRGRTESIELRGIERAGGAPVVLLPLETAYVPC